MGAAHRKPHTVWKDDEERKVVAEAVRYCRHDALNTIGDALFMAQQVLPEERRKEILYPGFKRKLFDLVDAEIKRQVKNDIPKQVPLSMRQEHQSEPLVVEPPAPPKPADPLDAVPALIRMFGEACGKALAEHLAPQLADKLGGTMKDALWNALGVMRTQATAAVATSKEEHKGNGNGGASKLPAKFDKHKVCVIGFPDSYRKNLQQHFPHLDMRFISGSAPAHVAKQTSENCEATYLMIKGSAHKVEQTLKSGSYTRINGSETDLKRVLTAKFPRTTSMDPAQAH